MKKYLLFGSAFIVAMSAYSQNARMVKPSGVLESKMKRYDFVEPSLSQSSTSTFQTPIKKAKSVVKPNNGNKVAAANLFTGSMNILGYLLPEQEPLGYNPAVNAVSFIARKSTTYSASSNSNSGTIVGLYSTNLGTSWNETCIWANANDLARYPQGGIFNPLGNTNINNAYLVGTGPFTSSAGGWGGTTNGNWYTSKQITTPGNNTPGADMQSSYYQGGFLKGHYMSRTSFSSIDGGLVRSMANIVADPAGTTNAAFGLRGALMVKGQFNAGAFVWSVDSFIPPVNLRTDGSPLIGSSSPLQAWSENGAVGYVILNGSRAGTSVPMKGLQPIVYVTTNFGASWSLLPANDFADPINFRGVNERMYPLNTNTNVICANFSGSEGSDATVDVNGQLHLVTMTYGHYYSHVDSLGYRYVFGTEQYSYDNSGPFGYPVIYDFYTKPSGGWDYHMVDSMGTEGPSGTSGQPGYGSNPWTSSTAKYALDARIQISRTPDGQKIFYSWTESDSAVTGVKWNIYPDLQMKGYDVVNKKVTPRYNITLGTTNMNSDAYFHYMSSKAAGSSSGCMTVPFTITRNGTYNGDIQVDTYYLDNGTACAASFSINPMSPKGLGVGITNQATVNFEVLNFPNPANDATTIVVGLKDASNFEVVIYNSIGQMVDTYKVAGQTGANEINIDLSNFNSGIYFYNVKVGGSVVTKKLIVQ
jgi:hypothetical protein